MAQNVGVGTGTPNAAAMLDVSSSDKGFLPPRLSTSQRNAMPNKTAGLVIFNTTISCLEVYNGSNWINLCSSLPSSILPKTLLGSNQSDFGGYIRQTADSGYIIGGSTNASQEGDVTGTNNGRQDCWIVKLSKTGAVEWDKVMGGSEYEELTQIKQTADGGYVFCAISESSASGDVTGTNHNVPLNNNSYDYWIVKLDASGNKTWDVLLGGDQNEFPTAIVQTADGGYAVGGYSYSSANGDVTSTNHGNSDFWIVKLTSTGTVTWNVLRGGSGEEEMRSLAQTADGGYIVSGSTTASGTGDVTGTLNGNFDFWVLKLTSTGTITWSRLIGGSDEEFSYAVQQTADGGYIVAGNSNSSASGNISVSTHGGTDYLVLKLNASGTTVWNKMLGGTGDETLTSVIQTADGGYVLAGYTTSSASGDVSQTSAGQEDAWIVKINSTGTLVWEKLYGGNQPDYALSIQETLGGGFIFGGYTNSSANGTVIGVNHSPGSEDLWLMRLDANGNIL
ncbi:MAG: hypothetical protein QM687_03785 [Ferruginibacter sp.]